jgi:hypothetical protein
MGAIRQRRIIQSFPSIPTPALPGSGYMGLISARLFRAPRFIEDAKL